MEILYRRLIPGEERAYRILYLEGIKTFPDSFGNRYEDQRKVEKLQFEEFIATGTEGNFVVGAFVDCRLVGIAGFRRGDRPKTEHRGEIVQMYVNADFQGRRIGESLLRSVIETAFALPGVELLELSAVAENSSAENLYLKLGFETYCVRKNYFKLGEKYWDQRFMELSKQKYFRASNTQG